MIQFNNNIYKTLNDKFYYGNKQVGYVYYGNTLVYPEFDNKVVTEEGTIDEEDIPTINGNVYDTGIQATGSIGVELIFNTTFKDEDSSFRAFFGTHDNSTSYEVNSNKYSSNSSFHFIINKDYKIRVRYKTYDISLNPSLSDEEKKAKLFWVSFKGGYFRFGTGGKIGENEKSNKSFSTAIFNGANLWINGHNQGYAYPTEPIREWIGGSFGLKIPDTKFHYIKIYKSDDDYYTFSFEECNKSDLYSDSNVQSYTKIIKRHYISKSEVNTDKETIYPFTYIKPNA